MRIYFYPECNFNINKAKTYDVTSLAEWFDLQHKNPDDYEIVGRDGKSHDSAYEAEVCAVYPRIMGGKSKGKNILKVVVGLALVLATGGTTAALFSNIGGLSMAHTLGAGLLLSGGGALLMGKMKMPSMDLSSDSATKENYQWNVGNLSTSRGVKGVTFGSNVIPEGELLAYRTYGTSTLEKLTRSETYYVNENYRTGRQIWDIKKGKYVDEIKTRKSPRTRSVDDSYLVSDDSSYLELLIGAGEGELDSITDIKINDISLSDLGMVENVDYAIRLGSNTQTALKQTNLDSQAGYQSIGQTVPVKLNGSVTPLLITTPADCDSCCIAFQAQNWYLYDTSSGAKNKAYIKPKIGYRLNGSTDAYTYIKTGVKEIDSGLPLKSESAFYFQVVIKFPSNGTYQISIENDSAELNNTKGLLSAAEYSGSALPDRAAINISVDNIACYNNKEQTYPGTALIWLRIPASQTLNGSMPKVTWKQTRASIYAYNGSSYVTKPADNLAWAIYDIIAQVRKDGNTYHNEGEDVVNIDFDKFVAFASFCDSIGAKGNWFLNKLDTSWSNAMSVATSCRAFIGLRSGKVCPYWDAPTEMTQIFTVGNYEDMSGVITAKKDRAKAIEATFNNEEEKFASRTVRVEIDNDHSAEAVSMTFAGLSNPVNVSKQAHYILRRNKYLVQSVKFTADIDSIVCELNDVIGIQCDLTEYGVGGRIFKVENNVISLDAPVTLESGKTYALLVRHTDGTLERNTPIETNGTFTQLTFNSAWSKPVLKGDVYSFGIANSEVRKYRVTGITRTNDLKAQIEAIEYNENVYDELAVAPYTYTNPNAGINNVTTTYTPEAVELAWDANNNTSYVNVYVDGVFYGRYQNGAQIPNINSEQLVEMFPVNEYGEEDTPVVRTISNNLPTPSTPPVPIVQSTTTGCVAEFDGIPKNENIVWLIIKEGDNELGRANILGEYMSVSIQLRSGTHTLSAYFVNQFSKSSQARTFTATPLGDIQANDISATALKLPTGSILRLSAKNCTTASIAEVNGVKDVSGRGNHGQAFGGVLVVKDDELGDCFSFDGVDDRISTKEITLTSDITLAICVNFNSFNRYPFLVELKNSSNNDGIALCVTESSHLPRIQSRKTGNSWDVDGINALTTGKWYQIVGVIDSTNNKTKLFVNAVKVAEGEHNNTSTLTINPIISGVKTSTSSDYRINGKVAWVKIYPRAISDTEVKTLFINAEEQIFGQMTADLIGANVIKGINLFSENIITQAAQINQAVFQSLIVTNGSTVANQVDVGGRNLLKASNINAANVTSYRIAIIQLGNDKPTENAQVTIQIKGTLQSGLSSFDIYNTTSQTVRARLTESDKENGIYKKTFSWKIGGTSNSQIFIYQYPSGSITTGSSIEWVKLEYGNKATTWTPAPEDVDADSTAKANAVKNGLGTNGYTSIHGGNIMTDTITADAIAANAITADKITVKGLSLPSGENFHFNLQATNDFAMIPDSSGQGNFSTMVGSIGIDQMANPTIGRYTNFAPSTSKYYNTSYYPMSGTTAKSVTLSAWIAFNKPSAADSSWTVYLGQQGGSYSGWGLAIFAQNLYAVIRTSANIISVNLGYSWGNWAHVVITINVNSSNITLKGYSDGVLKGTATLSGSTFSSALSQFRLGYPAFIGGSGSSSIPSAIRFADVRVFNRALSEAEVKTLYMLGTDTESGQITADRIATDAIKSRNYAYSSGLYSTAGTFLDLANGQIISKNFSIDSSGNATFKGALSGATGSFTGSLSGATGSFSGSVTASSGNIGDFTLSNGALTYSGTKYVTNTGIIQVTTTTTAYGTEKVILSSSMINMESSLNNEKGSYQAGYMSIGFNNFARSVVFDASKGSVSGDYGGAVGIITAANANCYGLYVEGKIRANSTDYGSDEKTKKDFQDVSTLDKLKKLRVCAWRFDEEKLVEKDNQFIDAENIKIEAENKVIDAENAEIEKENEKRKNRKDGGEVELLPLKEHKKLREHRIADKTANHPLNIGCMAGEFNKAFGTNDGSEDCLSVTDTIGVCMRAIQELAAEVDDLKAKLKIQQDEKSDVEQENQQEEQK